MQNEEINYLKMIIYLRCLASCRLQARWLCIIRKTRTPGLIISKRESSHQKPQSNSMSKLKGIKNFQYTHLSTFSTLNTQKSMCRIIGTRDDMKAKRTAYSLPFFVQSCVVTCIIELTSC